MECPKMLLSEYADREAAGFSAAKQILFAILHDLAGRSGLEDEWEQMSDDVQKETLQEWLNIIDRGISSIER